MAKQGWNLFLTCRHSFSALEKLKLELEASYSASCNIYQCDMGNHESVCQLFASLPALDVVINNAGISYVGLLTDTSPSVWDEMIRTNLTSCYNTCYYALPKMIHRKKGKIINVSSIWGQVGASMEVAYSASKGGVNSFTKALAKEVAPSNIQVNGVAFGTISTDMMNCYNIEEIESLINEIPANRIGTPEEAAELLLQLIQSPSYLTGQIITMDGGWF